MQLHTTVVNYSGESLLSLYYALCTFNFAIRDMNVALDFSSMFKPDGCDAAGPAADDNVSPTSESTPYTAVNVPQVRSICEQLALCDIHLSEVELAESNMSQHFSALLIEVRVICYR